MERLPAASKLMQALGVHVTFLSHECAYTPMNVLILVVSPGRNSASCDSRMAVVSFVKAGQCSLVIFPPHAGSLQNNARCGEARDQRILGKGLQSPGSICRHCQQSLRRGFLYKDQILRRSGCSLGQAEYSQLLLLMMGAWRK